MHDIKFIILTILYCIVLVVLTTFTLLYNRSLEIFHVKLKLHPLNNSQFPSPKTPGNENLTLFLCILTTLDNSYKCNNNDVCLFVTGLFQLIQYPESSSML